MGLIQPQNLFFVRIFPGIIGSGNTLALDLPFPNNKLPIKAGQLVPFPPYKVTPAYPTEYDVRVDVDSEGVYQETNWLNNVAMVKKPIKGLKKSRLELEISPSIDQMICFIRKAPDLEYFRKEVAIVALEEARLGLSGDEARKKYNASGNWCTEFARWVYLQAGIKDIGFSDASDVGDMFDIFAKARRLVWRNEFNPQTAEVGDYFSLNVGGEKKVHLGIIVGVTKNYEEIITVEGNVNDACEFQREPYFRNGIPDTSQDYIIDFIGKLDTYLFLKTKSLREIARENGFISNTISMNALVEEIGLKRPVSIKNLTRWP